MVNIKGLTILNTNKITSNSHKTDLINGKIDKWENIKITNLHLF